jgi:hypothetical protein
MRKNAIPLLLLFTGCTGLDFSSFPSDFTYGSYHQEAAALTYLEESMDFRFTQSTATLTFNFADYRGTVTLGGASTVTGSHIQITFVNGANPVTFQGDFVDCPKAGNGVLIGKLDGAGFQGKGVRALHTDSWSSAENCPAAFMGGVSPDLSQLDGSGSVQLVGPQPTGEVLFDVNGWATSLTAPKSGDLATIPAAFYPSTLQRFKVDTFNAPGYVSVDLLVAADAASVPEFGVPVVSTTVFAAMHPAGVFDPTAPLLVLRLLDGNGIPLAGIDAAAVLRYEPIFGGAAPTVITGYLDGGYNLIPGGTATSSSGLVVIAGLGGSVVVRGTLTGKRVRGGWTSTGQLTLLDVIIDDPVTLGTVSFTGDVLPAFGRHCVVCHNSAPTLGAAAGGLALDTPEAYAAISALVNTGSPDLSAILTKALVPTSTTVEGPHGDDTAQFASSDDPDYQLIRAWIAAGAPNN